MGNEKKKTIERRGFTASFETRAGEGENAPMILEGYAAVFESWSEELWGFREMVAPGAFSKTLQDGADVRALLNHNPDFVLGRTKSGTLTLSEDEKGLRCKIELPDTQTARDLHESVKRGDIDQMSFGFITVRDDWVYDEESDEVRRILKEVKLFDVSPVSFPAYQDTEVDARCIEKAKEVRAPKEGDPAPSQEGHPEDLDMRERELKTKFIGV